MSRRIVPVLAFAASLLPADVPAQNASVPVAKGDRGHIAVDTQVVDGNTLSLSGVGMSVKVDKNAGGVFVNEHGDVTVKAERKGLGASGGTDVSGTVTHSHAGSTSMGLQLKVPFEWLSGGDRKNGRP